MVNLLTCWNSTKNLAINVNQDLIEGIVRNNPEIKPESIPIGSTDNISINLLKLITAVATVQTRRKNPTKFNKLLDIIGHSDLLEQIKNCDNFCVSKHHDTDIQRTISEDLGVGLSVLVTDHYFKIDWTSIGKISRDNQSQPDIKCKTLSNEFCVIEAKGSITEEWRKQQIDYAKIQKWGPTAHVCVASCALLKENEISNVEYFDPPILPPENPAYEAALLKADHYTRVFNLIGQEELSRYFDYMRERIIDDRSMRRFREKQELYNRIKTSYVHLHIDNQQYYGNIEKSDNGLLFFVGVDERLLNVYNFINFEAQKDKHVKLGKDDFYVSADGLCMGFLETLEPIEDQIKMEQVRHHYDYFSITDFDYSRTITLENYFAYVVGQIGGKLIKERFLGSRHEFDLLFSLDSRYYIVEIKRDVTDRSIDRIIAAAQSFAFKYKTKFLLVTNSRLNPKVQKILRASGLIVIDRLALIRVIEYPKNLREYMYQG